MRMVHISRPVLFKGQSYLQSQDVNQYTQMFLDCHLPLRALWTDDYLASNVADVQVAITPDGYLKALILCLNLTCVSRADALVNAEDETVYFVEPLVETMSMEELLERLSTGSYVLSTASGGVVMERMQGATALRTKLSTYSHKTII
jgi:peptidyl-lysine (3S)-dioxygenase / protease